MPSPSLYWEPDGGLAFEAVVLSTQGSAVQLSVSGFFPGGGGQPADRGVLHFGDGARVTITHASRDAAGQIWHHTVEPAGDWTGERVLGRVDRDHRAALSRHHTALHILNALALKHHDGWITGCQIGPELSRIDFKLETPLAQLATELQARANDVIASNRRVSARFVSEAEFGDDVVRTLEARPPVIDGRVRVIEIEGFDAQACGGTHASNTFELGRLTVVRTENKGRINKRLYVRLA